MQIRDATEADIPALLAIHNEAVRTLDGIWISREDRLEDRTKWFADRKAQNFPILIAASEGGEVLGYGSYGTYRARDGYDLTVEHSVYLFETARGQGAGPALLARLIEIAQIQGRHMMVAIIDGENSVSLRLHENFGFTLVGTLPQSGKKRGRWRDQVSMYLLLDDRPAPPA